MNTYRQEQGVAGPFRYGHISTGAGGYWTIPLWTHIDRSRGLLDHSDMDTYRQEQGVAGPFRYGHI